MEQSDFFKKVENDCLEIPIVTEDLLKGLIDLLPSHYVVSVDFWKQSNLLMSYSKLDSEHLFYLDDFGFDSNLYVTYNSTEHTIFYRNLE